MCEQTRAKKCDFGWLYHGNFLILDLSSDYLPKRNPTYKEGLKKILDNSHLSFALRVNYFTSILYLVFAGGELEGLGICH